MGCGKNKCPNRIASRLHRWGHNLRSVENKQAPFGILSFKSHKLPRKVPSTLAAESQSMSEGTAEVEWLRGLFEELTNPAFTIASWRMYTRHRGLLHAARSLDPEKKLKIFWQLLTLNRYTTISKMRRLASQAIGE